MNTSMLRRSRMLWSSPSVPPDVNRMNQRKWIRAIRILGDKWVLAKYVERRDTCGTR